jgi:hypothetical protein
LTVSSPVQAVCFDIGETLVDETWHWTAIGAATGVPPLTVFGVPASVERFRHSLGVEVELIASSASFNSKRSATTSHSNRWPLDQPRFPIRSEPGGG